MSSNSASSSKSVDFSALVYGSLVCSLLEMTENVEDVNKKLDDIGYRIGLRLAHEFALDRNIEMIDTPEKLINDVLVKNWPIISGKTSNAQLSVIKNKNWPQEPSEYLIHFDESIFTRNVTIPELYQNVQFTAMLPGALRGIFEVFQYEATVSLENNNQNETGTTVRIICNKEIPPAIPKDDD